VFVDRAFDAALLICRGFVEVGFEAARDVEARIVEAAEEEPLDFGVVQANAELTAQLSGHLNHLSGIAHTRILHR